MDKIINTVGWLTNLKSTDELTGEFIDDLMI